MREWGTERLYAALFSFSSKLKPKTIIKMLPAVLKQNYKHELYETYVGTAVGAIAGMEKRFSYFIDMVDEKPQKIDSRTGQQIVDDVVAGAGLVVIDK